MSREARSVGHMELSTTDFSERVPSFVRRCGRCGAHLSASNRDKKCYPCQRHETRQLLECRYERRTVPPRRSVS
jgi:exosome complex RNA-binding protein Csl4